MKLKFDSLEFEIEGNFGNYKEAIEFSEDEKKIIITGKNRSGKTQLISSIVDSKYQKKIIGYLNYNLAFKFDKTKFLNQNQITIKPAVLTIFDEVFEEPVNNNNNITIKDLIGNLFDKIGKKEFEVFKPFNFLTFIIKAHDILNKKDDKAHDILKETDDPIAEINNDFEKISKNSINFNKDDNSYSILNQERSLTNPSSGELFILNFLALKCINKRKPFEILLFDEPDRHLEPKLIQYFFNLLNDEFKDTRIFLTTHRPDTILLSQNDSLNFKLCKLKQNEHGSSILEKYSGQTKDPSYRFFVLSTIFDLTYNLREIMNIKIRVYVESNDDYRFYNSLYHHLLDYCNFLRNLSEKDDSKKFDTVKQKQIFFDQFPILSRRYQLYFCTSALDNKGGDGGITMVEKNQKRDLTQRELEREPDLKGIKSFFDGDFFNSYGIIDRDGNEFKNNSNKYSTKFEILKRYNIENYIVDPMFLESDDKEKNYIEFTDDNLNARFQNFKNDINQNNLDLFLKIFIKEVLTSKGIKINDKDIMECVQDYIKNQEIPRINKKIKEKNIRQNLKDKYKALKDFFEKFVYKNQNYVIEDLVEYLVNDFHDENQRYYLINKKEKSTFKEVDLQYPSFLLNINGKILEAVLNKLVTGGFNLSSQIKDKDYTKMWISQDFVEIFSSINNQVRVYPIDYLIETELKKSNQTAVTTIGRADALEVVKKAGFSEKKFESCLQISSALNQMIS